MIKWEVVNLLPIFLYREFTNNNATEWRQR